MKNIRYYIIVSIVIGLLQIIDGLILSILGKGIFNYIFSFVEFIWVLVSIWAVIKFIKNTNFEVVCLTILKNKPNYFKSSSNLIINILQF